MNTYRQRYNNINKKSYLMSFLFSQKSPITGPPILRLKATRPLFRERIRTIWQTICHKSHPIPHIKLKNGRFSHAIIPRNALAQTLKSS